MNGRKRATKAVYSNGLVRCTHNSFGINCLHDNLKLSPTINDFVTAQHQHNNRRTPATSENLIGLAFRLNLNGRVASRPFWVIKWHFSLAIAINTQSFRCNYGSSRAASTCVVLPVCWWGGWTPPRLFSLPVFGLSGPAVTTTSAINHYGTPTRRTILMTIYTQLLFY